MKIITKVIVNWLKPIKVKFTGDMQSSFVMGRQAPDNIFLAQKVMHSMKNKKGKQGFMTIKIDLEKAYDRIERGFLENFLRHTDFNDHFISLIMRYTSMASLSIYRMEKN